MSALLIALSLVAVEVNINVNILLGAIARSLDLVQQRIMDSACGRSRPACNLLGILRNLNDNINIIGLAVLVGLQGVQSSCYNLLALVQLVLPNLLAGRLIVCRAVLISSLGVFVVQSLDRAFCLAVSEKEQPVSMETDITAVRATAMSFLNIFIVVFLQ